MINYDYGRLTGEIITREDFEYEEERKALEEGDIDKAFEMSCEADREKERNYYIKFPKLDNKNKPQKVWENLEAILKENKIIAYYNEITKEIEIEGLNIDNFESQRVKQTN